MVLYDEFCDLKHFWEFKNLNFDRKWPKNQNLVIFRRFFEDNVYKPDATRLRPTSNESLRNLAYLKFKMNKAQPGAWVRWRHFRFFDFCYVIITWLDFFFQKTDFTNEFYGVDLVQGGFEVVISWSLKNDLESILPTNLGTGLVSITKSRFARSWDHVEKFQAPILKAYAKCFLVVCSNLKSFTRRISSVTTEVWNFQKTTSRTINSFKDQEYWNPLLFLVDSDFCTK